MSNEHLPHPERTTGIGLFGMVRRVLEDPQADGRSVHVAMGDAGTFSASVPLQFETEDSGSVTTRGSVPGFLLSGAGVRPCTLQFDALGDQPLGYGDLVLPQE